MNKKLQILSALCALSLCQAASASINYYSLTMYASYNQNSDAMPADSPICYLVAQIGATTNGDLLTAQLVTPAPLTVDFYDASYQAGTFFQCYTGPYTSIGDMVGPEAFTEVRYLAHAKQLQALDSIPELAAEFQDLFGREAGGLIRP